MYPSSECCGSEITEASQTPQHRQSIHLVQFIGQVDNQIHVLTTTVIFVLPGWSKRIQLHFNYNCVVITILYVFLRTRNLLRLDVSLLIAHVSLRHDWLACYMLCSKVVSWKQKYPAFFVILNGTLAPSTT